MIRRMLLCMAFALGALHLPHPGLSAAAAQDAPPRSEGTFERAGQRLHYRDAGSGEALVLVHGLFGAADVWDEFAPVEALARRFRVVALDLRGHGTSSRPHDPADYGDEMVDDVIGLLDHLGIERAHVLGYSYGALVAGRLLERHPDRLATVILGGGSRIRPDHPEDVEWADALAATLEGGDGAAWLADALSAGVPEQDSAQRALIERRIASADLAASAAVLRSTGALVVHDGTIRDTDVPILAIVGGLDPSRGEVESMQGEAPTMEMVVIPDADHAGAPHTAMFWDTVVDWLRDEGTHRMSPSVRERTMGGRSRPCVMVDAARLPRP